MNSVASRLCCVLSGVFTAGGVACAAEETAKLEYRGSKDPRGLEPALSILYHAGSDTHRRSNILDAKLIFAASAGEKPFRWLGSDASFTAAGLMEKLAAAQAEKPRTAIVLAFDAAGAERALLKPLMVHAETFDVDVYRYGPVGRDYLWKDPIDLGKPRGMDPRTLAPSLTLMWPGMENGKRDRHSLEDALMIYSTVHLKHHILGIDRQFTKAQVTRGLERFYATWKPVVGGAKQPPPIVLGAENWGAGGDLYQALQKLAEERGVDVYLNYVCNFAGYPSSTDNDRRLAELIGTE